ncbi:hypothetical protein N665_0223s0025 [Sinapis alba]|nr:hypothetical protein N665_0223s0025 [Sinapis alba]
MGRVMAEPPENPMWKARDVLASPSHQGLERVVSDIFMGQETTEHQTAKALFHFFTINFANCLTLKLLHMYQSSSVGVHRYHLTHLLFQTLLAYKNRKFELSLLALNEIKPLLISCLRMQETPEMKLFSRIVCFVAYDVMKVGNGGWDELSECIFEISSVEPLKALHIFVDLPPMYERFIYSCFGMIVEKAKKVLLMPDQDRVEDWSLGLQAVVKLGIQHLDSVLRSDSVKSLLTLLVKAASDLVDKGMEQFLGQGLADLDRFLSREKKLYNYNKDQCDFVSVFWLKIKDLEQLTKEATGEIHGLVKSAPSLVQQPQEHGAASEREWFDRLNNLPPLEILRIFASTDVEERFRDMAIRRLNVLLSDYILREESTDPSLLRQLQPLLISCLWKKEGISESMFKVLGEVVYSVAFEMMTSHVEIWEDLGYYITSHIEKDFQRAVYIFQCLTMWLHEDFIDPIVENLLPEINKRLYPPTDVLLDNSCWVLAFLGAFCAITQLVAMQVYAGTVVDMADKMVDSVRELVQRKMEVGFVRRAFRDLEIIVKKQMEWFSNNEYILTKSLLQRLYLIEGMTMESKMVLWRINVFVDRGMADHVAA